MTARFSLPLQHISCLVRVPTSWDDGRIFSWGDGIMFSEGRSSWGDGKILSWDDGRVGNLI